MTLREKFSERFPNSDIAGYCPSDFNWYEDPNYCPEDMDTPECSKCWDREIPETPTEEKTVNERRAEEGLPPVVEPHILDSGDRTQFESGAVRDMREGKGRCDLMPLEVVYKYFELVNAQDKVLWWISSFQKNGLSLDLYNAMESFCTICWACDPATMFLEVAKHFEEGAKKYGESNWQKGIPVHCYIDSAVRHYLKWLRGDNDEPHDRAFVWNIMCCIWEVDYHDYSKVEEC